MYTLPNYRLGEEIERTFTLGALDKRNTEAEVPDSRKLLDARYSLNLGIDERIPRVMSCT